MENYTNVPEIITGKDLDYLTDMFNWFYLAYKETLASLDEIENQSFSKHIEKCVKTFYENMNIVLSILKGGLNENK